MNSKLKVDPNKLLIFHELKKRRIYVGELIYDKKKDVYKLFYNKNYVNSASAIPIGVDLTLFSVVHTSKKGQLFSSFQNRIPEKENPAYVDYCRSKGISVKEKNPIILLGTIGSCGPSSFMFERVYKPDISIEDVINLRKKIKITQYDLAKALDISKVTLQKIESGESRDVRTIKLLEIYFSFPEVAIWQIHKTGSSVHSAAQQKLLAYFYEKKKTAKI